MVNSLFSLQVFALNKCIPSEARSIAYEYPGMCSACFLFSSFVCLAYQNKSFANATGLEALKMDYNPE